MATQLAVAEVQPPVTAPTDNSEAPLTDREALLYDETIKRYATTVRYGWWELGEAARVIKQRALWKQFSAPAGEEPFHSFDDYVNRRGQKSRTSIYRGLQLRTGLTDIPENDCRVMSQANAIWLLRMVKRVGPKKALSKAVIANAASMQEDEFAKYCNDKLPGAAKEESKENITFSGCEKSLAKVVDEAIKVALWEISLDSDPVEDKRDALERICIFFLDSKCEHEGYSKLSNREAFQKAKKRKVA